MECDPSGLGAKPDVCNAVGVRRYPTWVIAGNRYEGVMTLGELAKASAFTPPQETERR